MHVISVKKKNPARAGPSRLVGGLHPAWGETARNLFAGGSKDIPVSALPVYDEGGVKQTSAVKDGHLQVYDGKAWKPQFWSGVNMGATTPGHAPGELSPTKEDYLRWFGQIKAMHADVVRIYTILPPHFYEALAEFNAGRKDRFTSCRASGRLRNSSSARAGRAMMRCSRTRSTSSGKRSGMPFRSSTGS